MPIKELGKKLYENVMGTEEQNKAAAERMAKEDEKAPDTVQAKVNRMVEKINPSKEPVKKAKGGYVRAADGCAQRGKTKGRMV
jgi:hypothetical protein